MKQIKKLVKLTQERIEDVITLDEFIEVIDEMVRESEKKNEKPAL